MSTRHAILKRIGLSLVIGLLAAWIMSEASFLLQNTNVTREPRQVEIVIPPGTADRVAQGQAVPSLPADMTFVVGDTLVVKNEDATAHQLGPVWVPPGTSGKLSFDQANQYSYSCTFQPTQYLGLAVRSRVTWTTRLTAILLAGLPTSAMLAVYSLVAFPIKKTAAQG
jgi:hypothetical protein